MIKCRLCQADAAEKYDLYDFRVLKCSLCGVEFLDIPMSRLVPVGLYDETYYRKRGEYYFQNSVADPVCGKEDDNIHNFSTCLKLLRNLSPQGKRLLDLGCGIGIFLKLAQREGWDVKGLDISKFAAQYARDVFNLDVHEGPLADADFPADTFDVVTMWDTLEHIADPLVELGEVRRILKPGGLLMLDTPNQESLLRELADLVYKISYGKCRYPVRRLYHMYHLYYFNVFALTNILEGAGFKVLFLRRQPIPVVKARGSRAEKAIVKILSLTEKVVGREYELFVVAQKTGQ